MTTWGFVKHFDVFATTLKIQYIGLESILNSWAFLISWAKVGFLCSCQNKSTNPVSCLASEYSPSGRMTCSDCPKGFYCPQAELSSPIACPNGTYSVSIGAKRCLECPAGNSCMYSDQSPVECKNGTYSTGSSLHCSPCPAGYRYGTVLACIVGTILKFLNFKNSVVDGLPCNTNSEVQIWLPLPMYQRKKVAVIGCGSTPVPPINFLITCFLVR